jgi:hypothetical protein
MENLDFGAFHKAKLQQALLDLRGTETMRVLGNVDGLNMAAESPSHQTKRRALIGCRRRRPFRHDALDFQRYSPQVRPIIARGQVKGVRFQ